MTNGKNVQRKFLKTHFVNMCWLSVGRFRYFVAADLQSDRCGGIVFAAHGCEIGGCAIVRRRPAEAIALWGLVGISGGVFWGGEGGRAERGPPGRRVRSWGRSGNRGWATSFMGVLTLLGPVLANWQFGRVAAQGMAVARWVWRQGRVQFAGRVGEGWQEGALFYFGAGRRIDASVEAFRGYWRRVRGVVCLAWFRADAGRVARGSRHWPRSALVCLEYVGVASWARVWRPMHQS